MLVNLSNKGLCVETSERLEPGEQIVVHLAAGDGDRDLIATVRWVRQAGNGNWAYGLEVENVEAAEAAVALAPGGQPCTFAVESDYTPGGSGPAPQ